MNKVKAEPASQTAAQLAWAGGFAAAWMIFFSIYRLYASFLHDKPSGFLLALIVSLCTLHGVKTMIQKAGRSEGLGYANAHQDDNQTGG